MAQSNCDVSLIIKEKAEKAFWLWRSNEVALPLSLELTFFIKDKISTLKLSNVMAIGLCTIFDSTYFALLTIIMCCCQFFYYFFFVLFTFTKDQTKSKRFFHIDVSSKKQTNDFYFTTLKSHVDVFFFLFWRKLKTPKRHFEINCPLGCQKYKFQI